MKTNNSRPVRLSTFVLYCVANDEKIENEQFSLTGEFVTKSDVHYCAEKDAIDMVNGQFRDMDMCEYIYLLYKVSKERDEEGNPKSVTLVSRIYGDEDTKQVVID